MTTVTEFPKMVRAIYMYESFERWFQRYRQPSRLRDAMGLWTNKKNREEGECCSKLWQGLIRKRQENNYDDLVLYVHNFLSGTPQSLFLFLCTPVTSPHYRKLIVRKRREFDVIGSNEFIDRRATTSANGRSHDCAGSISVCSTCMIYKYVHM